MAINTQLAPGETIVFSGKAPEIMIKNGSSFGTYYLVITSLKRIIVHDTGGFFGNEKTFFFPSNQKVKIELIQHKVHMKGNTIDFHFDFGLDIMSFTSLYEKLGKDFFELVPAQNLYAFLFTQLDSPFLVEYLLKDKEILFKEVGASRSFKIDLSDIKDINYFSNLIYLTVPIDLFGEHKEQVILFVPNIENERKLLALIHQRETIYQIAEKDETITSAHLKCQLDSENRIEYEVYLLEKNESIRIVLKHNLKTIMSKSKSEFEEYFHFNAKQTVLDIGGSFFFISPNQTNSNQMVYVKNEVNQNYYVYIENAGDIRGLLNGVHFSGEQVDLAISLNGITILTYASKLVITKITFSSHKVIMDGNLLLLLSKNEITSIELEESHLHYLTPFQFPEYKEENILFNDEKQPYYFHQTENGLALFRESYDSPKYLFRNQSFGNVHITTKTYSHSFLFIEHEGKELIIPADAIRSIIYQAFTYSKSPVLVNTETTNLFTSLVRQISDLVIYEYFSQLSALYKGIDQFYEETMAEAERTSKLVSYLYYGIQSQRKRMDHISVYLPSMLNKIEQDLFQQLGKTISDRSYKELQTRLLSITVQIKSSLMEIENSLSHLSSVLISKRSTKELIEARKQSGYTTAGIALAVSAGLTILTGGATLPLLLAPTYMGLNTRNTAKAMQLQEEIQTENEQNRVQFYVEKAIDAFDHFMQTMAPYYIYKVNDAIYECYKKQSRYYKPFLQEPKVKESMFQRIAEIYTFKKLPVDATVELSKEDLLKEIFDIAELGEQKIQNYESILQLPNKLVEIK